MSDFQQAKDTFLQQLHNDDHVFASTLEFIETWFDFTPSAFNNGEVVNAADQNQGSCKVFALAHQLELTQEQALRCFGEHYRDVLATPDVDNHHNLRRLLKEGLSNIQFDQFPLAAKAV
ncbi:HopJ type III effector protein [Bacterioplanoides pacificum]|uniref:HopJ type III effector protein n=1 Tax=Bacterioplanoides pacificum TaxID=1171596 RepID=A0ABV7VMV8_9GAMM